MNRAFTAPSARLAALCASSFSLFAAVVFWWLDVRNRWWPDGDEFALLANSAVMFHPKPWLWFVRGYRDYLLAYPELSGYRSNFIRPVANIVYFLDSLVFGRHWDLYLLPNMLVFALVVGLAVYLGAAVFRLSRPALWLLGLAVFLTPAQDQVASLYANGDLDMIASGLILLTLLGLLRQRYALALMAVSVAVFTKETAHFAPLLSILVVRLQQGRWNQTARKYALLFPVPLLLLYGLRAYAFHGTSLHGVYVFAGKQSVGQSLWLVLVGLLTWPLHVYTSDLAGITGYTTHHWLRWLLRLPTLLFWVAAALTFTVLWRRQRSQPGGDSSAACNPNLLYLLLFTVGSVLLPTGLNLAARFGAIFFPLFALTALTAYGCLAVQRHWLRLGWGALLLVFLLLELPARANLLHVAEDSRPRWAINHSLLEQVQHAKPGLLLIVDDYSNFDASTQWLGTVAGYQGQIVRVNDVLPKDAPDCPALSKIHVLNAETVQVQFPADNPCADAMMRTAPPDLPEHWSRTVGRVTIDYVLGPLSRPRSATIHLPAGVPASILSADLEHRRYLLTPVS